MAYADFIWHPRHNQTPQEAMDADRILQNRIQNTADEMAQRARAYSERVKQESNVPKINQSPQEVIAADAALLEKVNQTAEAMATRAEEYLESQKAQNV